MNDRKLLGDIRGVTYIYGMFYRFGLIDVPDEAKRKDEESVQQIVLTRMPQRGRGRSITQCLRSLRDPEITQKIRLRNEPQAAEITL